MVKAGAKTTQLIYEDVTLLSFHYTENQLVYIN